MSPVHDLQAFAPPAESPAAKFPAVPYASAAAYFDAYAEETARAASSIEPAALDRAAAILLEAYTRGAGVFACGNGGSAAIANHLQCDHVKGVRTDDRPCSPRGEPQRQRRAPHRDRQRHGVRRRLRVPASVAVETRRRPHRRLVIRSLAQHRARARRGPATTACARSHSPASTEATPRRWPRSPFMSTARTTASSRTCTRPSCTPWPSTSASRE